MLAMVSPRTTDPDLPVCRDMLVPVSTTLGLSLVRTCNTFSGRRRKEGRVRSINSSLLKDIEALWGVSEGSVFEAAADMVIKQSRTVRPVKVPARRRHGRVRRRQQLLCRTCHRTLGTTRRQNPPRGFFSDHRWTRLYFHPSNCNLHLHHAHSQECLARNQNRSLH